jgi:hypothetical protein
MLYVAMLRESGIAAGIVTGINIDSSGSGSESGDHAKVFIPWPVAKSQREYIFLEIDATPANTPLRHRTPSTLDKQFSDGMEGVVTEGLDHAEPAGSFVLGEIEALGAEEIRLMARENLEQALNSLLAKMTPENTSNLEDLLGLALYSSIKSSDGGFAASASGLRLKLNNHAITTESPRYNIFEMLSSYVQAQARHISNEDTAKYSDPRGAAISKLEYIVERGKCALSPREFSAAILSLAYLRSDKMQVREVDGYRRVHSG